MRIEVFVADCPLWRQVLATGERYGVHTVIPAIAVGGKVVHQGRLTLADVTRFLGGGHA